MSVLSKPMIAVLFRSFVSAALNARRSMTSGVTASSHIQIRNGWSACVVNQMCPAGARCRYCMKRTTMIALRGKRTLKIDQRWIGCGLVVPFLTNSGITNSSGLSILVVCSGRTNAPVVDDTPVTPAKDPARRLQRGSVHTTLTDNIFAITVLSLRRSGRRFVISQGTLRHWRSRPAWIVKASASRRIRPV